MMFLTKSKVLGDVCYIELKDLIYLANMEKNDFYFKRYQELKQNNMSDNDFVRIRDPKIIDDLQHNDKLFNYLDYYNVAVPALGMCVKNLLIQGEERKASELSTLLNRKIYGNLRLPLLPDGVFERVKGDMYFYSTIESNCFVLKILTNNTSKDEYEEFINSCLQEAPIQNGDCKIIIQRNNFTIIQHMIIDVDKKSILSFLKRRK